MASTLKSPAYGVPAEPPFKRQKVTDSGPPSSNGTPTLSPAINSSSSAPIADLGEQLDLDERKKYIKGKEIGSGTYANVYEARLRSDPSKLFAIKKIKVGSDEIRTKIGISYDSLREIKFLQELDHPNIIKLYSVFSTKDQNLNLVLEHLPQGDMTNIIHEKAKVRYTAADIKAWFLMLMRGVWWCHKNFILHRDIKPGNLLIAANGEIKLADFGLARSFADPTAQMTPMVITDYYRPPELFFQAKHYSGVVDVWSCGCLFAEMILRDFFLPGVGEVHMMRLICERIGTPTEENWPGVTKLKNYLVPVEVPLRSRDSWNSQFRTIGEPGVDLLIAMLTLDPNKRLTAEQVLKHPYFVTASWPTPMEELPKKGGGVQSMGDELAKKGGELPERKGRDRTDGVARKIDFGAK